MLFSMEADLQVKKSDELFAKLQSQHMEKLLLCLRWAYENFLGRTRLRSTIKTDFFSKQPLPILNFTSRSTFDRFVKLPRVYWYMQNSASVNNSAQATTIKH